MAAISYNLKTKLILLLGLFVCIACREHITKSEPASVEKIIAIQPLGDFDTQLADTVSQEIQKAYSIKTVVLSSNPLPQHAFVTIRSPRYRADSLIKHLLRIKPDSIYIIIGLTNKDISITKTDSLGNIKKPVSKYTDFGIFGLGFQPGPSCIVSTYRYMQGNKHVFYQRFFKICKHEIGHNLGLPHCTNQTCIMQDAAETIKTIDKAGNFLCEKCKLKLKSP